MKHNQTILVTGATGQQGGATARHLLAKGWPVRAMTRNPNSSAAQTLKGAGAEVVQGDLDDCSSLDRALAGVYGLFSVQTPELGVETEERHGKALADAAQAAGIHHIVYSSVGGAERGSGVPHFESKWQIEKYIRSLDLPATILRPVYFMDNLNWQRTQIQKGALTSMGLAADKTLQMIAATDIGAFAALAFESPDSYIGESLEIAGDELTETQIAETFAAVIGRPVKLVPAEGPPAFPDLVKMYAWFNQAGYEADIPALRGKYPTLLSFKTWVQDGNWKSN
jgi:uncharacterized protein YbjT (DUF2867 family)